MKKLPPLVEASTALTADEAARYLRQTVIPEIGALGQARIRNAKVLSIGAGGLGSPVLMYLAAAGVGTDILCEKGVLRLRRINAIEQTLEILLPGEAARVVEFEKSACGLKQEAIEVMKCLSNNQLESTVMSHQSSLQLMQNLDQIRLITGINC